MQNQRRTPQPPPRTTAKPSTNALPQQKPITDEPMIKPPAQWKGVLKRVLIVLGVLAALALVYIFLLLGEPSEDSALTQGETVVEDVIRVPMTGMQLQSDGDLNPFAANFGKPILSISSDELSLIGGTLSDTAFQGGYARRVQLTYSFADGTQLLVESIRPTAAVTLLGQSATLRVDSLYTLAGLNAVRMDSSTTACVFASGKEAVYAVVCPSAHADELSALTKQVVLLQPSTVQ